MLSCQSVQHSLSCDSWYLQTVRVCNQLYWPLIVQLGFLILSFGGLVGKPNADEHYIVEMVSSSLDSLRVAAQRSIDYGEPHDSRSLFLVTSVQESHMDLQVHLTKCFFDKLPLESIVFKTKVSLHTRTSYLATLYGSKRY